MPTESQAGWLQGMLGEIRQHEQAGGDVSSKTLHVPFLSNHGSDVNIIMTTINFQWFPAPSHSLTEHPKIQTGVHRRNDPSYQGQPISHFPSYPVHKTQ